MLTLYTDGLVEQQRDWERGEQRLTDAVLRLQPKTRDPAAALLREIIGDAAPSDDIAILTFNFGRVS